MYREFEDAVHSRGALLFYLPPYSPQLSPIEFGFAVVKRWIQRHLNMAFVFAPNECLIAAFEASTTIDAASINTFNHCGYGERELIDLMF